ncbi:hypothetical protein CI102_4314 [Trichoderma harzianum]|nr:hypothetical protein CI102_4314 [Trichoderma harzianum]
MYRYTVIGRCRHLVCPLTEKMKTRIKTLCPDAVLAYAGVSLQLQSNVFMRKGANKKKRGVEDAEEDEDADSDAEVTEEAEPKVDYKGEPESQALSMWEHSHFCLTTPCCGRQTSAPWRNT